MNGKIKELEQALEQLPEKERQAVLFLMEHERDITQMCRMEPLTPCQRETYIKRAVEDHRPLLLALVLLEEKLNETEIRKPG